MSDTKRTDKFVSDTPKSLAVDNSQAKGEAFDFDDEEGEEATSKRQDDRP